MEFRYLFLAQMFNNPELADLTSNTAVNIVTCLVFVALAVFVYWGWDVCLTVNEETKGGRGIAGRAGTTTAVAVLALYLAVIVATMVAGTGADGIGLNNPDNQSNAFAALASPVMGPLAILMSLAVLSGTASSLQSTMASPARSLLAMGHYGALPPRFASVSKRFGSCYATVMAGLISGRGQLALEFGSGSEVFGVGLVFILGIGVLALGVVVLLVAAKLHPGFFRGETIRKDAVTVLERALKWLGRILGRPRAAEVMRERILANQRAEALHECV